MMALFIPVVLVLGVILWTFKKFYLDYKECSSLKRLDGKVVIVTGCNQGIGYETVGELARRGARVIMACRDLVSAEAARLRLIARFGEASFKNSTGLHLTPIQDSQLECEKLDLQSFSSIRAFADRVKRREQVVDILINNAAIAYSDPIFGDDGIELHLKVNHLGPFLLTNLLHDSLSSMDPEDPSRVINVSSFNHRLAELNLIDLNRPSVGSSYSSSKLANVVHARELSKRWESSSIVAVSVHPGLVKTELLRNMRWTRWAVHFALGWLAKTPLQGSQSILHCCLSDDLTSGTYYSECRPSRINPQAMDSSVGERFWLASEQLVQRWEAHSKTKQT